MINKEDSVVLSLRTKEGLNLMGFYVGESTQKLSGKPSVILYRPIKIVYVEYMKDHRRMQNYVHELYFPFGGAMVEILHEDIANSEMASQFFSMYYTKVLGEHIVHEEHLHNSIIAHYEKKNIEDVMSETDSFYMKQETEFLQ